MNIVIWGTGPKALEFAGLCDPAKVSVLAFVDEDPARQGTTFLGREVLAPGVVSRLTFDALFLSTRDWQADKERIAREFGVPAEKIRAYYQNRFALLREIGREGLIPANLTDEDVARLDSVPWYHSVEVFPGVFTPGWAELQIFLIDQLAPEQTVGKKVLDIGAWTGPYTFEMERRGALVTAYDIQDPQTSGFNLLKSMRGAKAEYIRDSVYNLPEHFDKTFDVIMFFGVYYHLFNPMLAFTNIHRSLKDDGIMLFEGAVLEYAYDMDPEWAARKDRMEPYLEVPLAYFTQGDCYGHWSNWYVPNVLCLREWIMAAGFEILDMYLVRGGSRAYGMARKSTLQVPTEHSR